MVIDPDSPEHPYEQLARHLRDRIRAGDITGRLPSLMRLVEETGLSLNTAQKAVKVLADEGVVFTMPGRGVFVRKN